MSLTGQVLESLKSAEEFLDRHLSKLNGIDLSVVKSLQAHARGYPAGPQYAFRATPGFSILIRIGAMPSSSGETSAILWMETAMIDSRDPDVLRWCLQYNHALSACWRISLLNGRFLGTEAMIDLTQVRKGRSTEEQIKSALLSAGLLWNVISEEFPNLNPLLMPKDVAACH